MALNNFTQRTLSGAVYVAVIVGSILWQEAAFFGIATILAILAVREFNRLTHPRCPQDLPGEIGAMLLCFAVEGALLLGMPPFNYFTAAYAIVMMAAIILQLWEKEANPIIAWGNLLIGQVLFALPFALMNILNHISGYLLLAVFVLIWVNDSGAYCVGVLTAKRKNGNHKMFPRVSPKKSWEGLIGGIVLAMAVGALLAYFGWFDAVQTMLNKYVLGVLFALMVAVFGTLGDLVESLLKRTIGVKDSGRFLPGHGGVLDRFDSILLAVPAVLVFVLLLS